MKKFVVFTISFFLFSATVSTAQISQHWEKVYEVSSVHNNAYSGLQTIDGGYVIAGTTLVNNLDFSILKLDCNGDVSWLKIYGGEVGDIALSIQQTPDGGYIVAGWTNSFGAGGIDILVIKLDEIGEVVWQKTYGGNDWDGNVSIQQTSDGGFILYGLTKSFGAGDLDCWIIKIDSFGDVTWQKTYGGSQLEGSSYSEKTFSIHETIDGGYIFIGSTQSFGAGSADYWVVKLTSEGDIAWQKTYGGNDYDLASSIEQTSDGGYIVAGGSFSFGTALYSAWVLKLDENGNISWQKAYDGEGFGLNVTDVVQTLDGSYVVVGNTTDNYLFAQELDPNGNVLWFKTFSQDFSGHLPKIQQTTGGGYVIATTSEEYTVMRTFDFWVLKLDSNGNIPGCDVIYSEELFVYDTSISGLDSVAIAQSSNATITNTNIVPFNRSHQVSEICNYVNPADIDGDGVDSMPEGLLTSNTSENSFLTDEDNCPDTPNGPYLGTCVTGDTYKIGRSCIDDTYCGTGGFCSMNQEETNGSGMGDACYLCESDFDCDEDCDGTDAGQFKLDFGRSGFNNPCPTCTQGDWCIYP